MMFATVAFSIDAMLPAMPEIARDLALSNPQFAPLVLMIFVVGLGLGTIVMGPLSDAYGRRPVVFLGLGIYVLGAAGAWLAQDFTWMLIARFVQGVGAAGPRVVSAAIVRDLFKGREMASIISLALMVFLTVPAIAPMIGAFIISVADWRSIFLVFLAFACLLTLWYTARLDETLPKEFRRPIRVSLMRDAVVELFQHPVVRLSIVVQTLMMAELFSILSMVQPIFEQTFDAADTFPFWFGALAIASAVSSLLNARLVLRFGMRRLITTALGLQAINSGIVLLLLAQGVSGAFWIYLYWQFTVFLQAGLTTANLNAIAAEPMGHIAGMAASVMGGVSAIGGAVIAGSLGFLFDGTPLPLITIILVLSVLASMLMQAMRRAELEAS